MYTITLLNDRRLYGAHKEAIMQYDNMVGKIQFLIPQTYDGNDKFYDCIIGIYLPYFSFV